MARHGACPGSCFRRRLLVLAAAIVAAIAGGASHACADGPAPNDLSDAIARIEGDLPAVPEVASGPDAALVMRALRDGREDGESRDAAGRLYRIPLAASADAADIGPWTRAAAQSVRAYGVFVRDTDADRIVAAGAYWVSPLVTRLHVVRLPDDAASRMPDAALLEVVGSCEVEVDEWIEIPVDIADRLIARSDGAQAYLAGSEPGDASPRRRWVDVDALLDAAAFRHPATSGLSSFSAWFVGSGPGPVALGRALPRVRSSLGPRDLWALIRGIR